jgi:hypothetical protein
LEAIEFDGDRIEQLATRAKKSMAGDVAAMQEAGRMTSEKLMQPLKP